MTVIPRGSYAYAVNALDYGAIGDGITDDTIALQAALDIGGLVLLPATDAYYKITADLTITVDSTRFVGTGKPHIVQATAGQRIFTVSADHVIIDGMRLSETSGINGTNDVVGVYVAGTSAVNMVDDFSLTNCELDWDSVGIELVYVDGARIINSQVISDIAAPTSSSSAKDAITVTASDYITVDGCTIDNSGGRAYVTDGGNHHVVSNCTITDCAQGLALYGVMDAEVCHCRIIGKNTAATTLFVACHCGEKDSIYGLPSGRRIHHNYISGELGFSQGVLVHGGTDIVISDNVISEISQGISVSTYDPSPGDGSEPAEAGNLISGVSIANNQIVLWDEVIAGLTSSSPGIICSGEFEGGNVTDITITGNVIRNAGVCTATATAAIKVQAISNIVIEGNVLLDGAGSGVYFHGTSEDVDSAGIVCRNNVIKDCIGAGGDASSTAGVIVANASLVEGVFDNYITGCYSAYRNVDAVCPHMYVVSRTENLNTIASVGRGAYYNFSGGATNRQNHATLSTDAAGADIIGSITIPAGSLVPGNELYVTAAGTKTGSTGNKTISWNFGSACIEFHAAAANTNDWRFTATIYVAAIGAGTRHVWISWVGYDGVTVLQGFEDVTSEDEANDIVCTIVGTCASATDAAILKKIYAISGVGG